MHDKAAGQGPQANWHARYTLCTIDDSDAFTDACAVDASLSGSGPDKKTAIGGWTGPAPRPTHLSTIRFKLFNVATASLHVRSPVDECNEVCSNQVLDHVCCHSFRSSGGSLSFEIGFLFTARPRRGRPVRLEETEDFPCDALV